MVITKLKVLLAPYPNVLKWYEELALNKKSKIICWNLVREFEQGCCPEIERKAFLQDLDSFLKNKWKLRKTGVEKVFREVRKKYRYCLPGKLIVGSIRAKDRDCCFEVKGRAGIELVPKICRLQDIESFHRHTIFRSGRFVGEALEYVKKIVKKEDTPYGTLNTKNGYVWVTKLEEFKKALANITEKDERWKKACNLLGLTISDHFILIKYPDSFAPQMLAQPTFIEGDRATFRIESSPDAWNKTVNLENGEPGLPEAIHCPYDLTQDFEFELLDLENFHIAKRVNFDFDLLLKKVCT